MNADLEKRRAKAAAWPELDETVDPRKREARRLWVEEGLTDTEIATRYGVGRTTIAQWRTDPYGVASQARKARYERPCSSCGAKINPGGLGKCVTGLCQPCLEKKMTRDAKTRVIEKLREWDRLYGKPPSASEWNPALAINEGHPEKAERHRRGDWPSPATAQAQFGSWNAALEAAGLPVSRRVGPGYRYRLTNQDIERTVRIYEEEGTLERAAARIGITPSGVQQRLMKASGQMAAQKKPIVIIEREIEKTEARVERLKAELEEATIDLGQLRGAHNALSGRPLTDRVPSGAID